MLVTTIALCASVSAQDAHFSQFDASPMMANPAMTGMFDVADFRIGSNFRSQWGQLTHSFVSTAISFDMPIEDRFGLGGHMVNYDQGGVINTFNMGASAAYNIADPRAKFLMTVGLHAGFLYKKINDVDLLFDNQYADGYFDSRLPSGENFEKGGRLMPDVSLGIAYKSNNSRKTTNPYFNFSAHHLTSPDENILSSVKSELPIRYSASGGVIVAINRFVFLRPMAMYQKQRNDQSLNIGLIGKKKLDGTIYEVIGGLSHRVQDAAIIHLGLKHGLNTYRFSYDLNTSSLGEFTGRKGAIEFSIIYYGSHTGRSSSKRASGARF